MQSDLHVTRSTLSRVTPDTSLPFSVLCLATLTPRRYLVPEGMKQLNRMGRHSRHGVVYWGFIVARLIDSADHATAGPTQAPRNAFERKKRSKKRKRNQSASPPSSPDASDSSSSSDEDSEDPDDVDVNAPLAFPDEYNRCSEMHRHARRFWR